MEGVPVSFPEGLQLWKIQGSCNIQSEGDRNGFQYVTMSDEHTKMRAQR